MSMSKFILLVLLAISGTDALAQQQYFLYIQATPSQPFYARIHDHIYSSSENGYAIVPRLHDSTYDVFIGFARNVIPEQHFLVEINKGDQGFELRGAGDKGWGLFNLQSTAVVMNSTPVQNAVAENAGEKKNDAFSQMLANVVNDSAILYTAPKPVATTPAQKPGAAPPAQNGLDTTSFVSTQPTKETKPATADSSLVAGSKKEEKTNSTVVPSPSKPLVVTKPIVPAKNDTVAKAQAGTEKPFIARLSEVRSDEGYKAIYVEQYNLLTDTINIEIPAKEVLPVAPPVLQQTVPPPDKSAKRSDTVVTVPVSAPPALQSADTAAKKKEVVITNSDCKNFAGDNDVDKLRVKLLAANAVDDKLVAAKKYFRSKCFSVRQIKALSELFPTDETRYQFFDTAYPYVSDTENFGSLDEMIVNDYYKTRFKAMIRR